MSAYLSFSESREVRLPEWPAQMRSGIMAILLGISLLYVAIAVFIPSDMYSTARWYDMLGVNEAIAGDVPYFDLLNPVRVSEEGFWFSVFVSVANLSLAYQAAFGGHWLENDPSSNLFTLIKHLLKGKEKRPINTIKLGYLLILVGITIFETYTGMEFRMTEQSASGALKAGGVAFVVENAGSDWGFTLSIAMLIGGTLQTYNAYVSGRGDLGKLRDTISGRRSSSKHQPEGESRLPQTQNQNPRLPQKPQHTQRQESKKPQPPSGHPHGGRREPVFVAPVPADHTGYRVVSDEEPPDMFIMPHFGGAPRQ